MYELAELAKVHENTIGNWKKEDHWDAKLAELKSQRKPGGQPGNQNAKGHGAPIRNKNGEKHGAYSTVTLEDLTPEERFYILSLDTSSYESVLEEFNLQLQQLYAKDLDLARRIKELENSKDQILDKEVEVSGDYRSTSKTYVNKFRYIRILTQEQDRVQGRIIRLLDTIRNYHVDRQRLLLEERKHNLNKQRVSGVIVIDPDTNEIVDA